MSNSSSRMNFMESYIHIDYSDKESYVRKRNSYHIMDEQISSLSDKNNQNNNYDNNKMNNNNLLESDENIFITSTATADNNNNDNYKSSHDKTENSIITNIKEDNSHNKYKTNNSNSTNSNRINIFNNTYNGNSNNYTINTALRESCNGIEIINNIINGKIKISQNMTENTQFNSSSSSFSKSYDDTDSSSTIVGNTGSRSSGSSSCCNNNDENNNNICNRHSNSSDHCSFGSNSSKFDSINTATKNIRASSSSSSRTIRPTIFCYPCLLDLKRKIDKEIQNEQLRNTLYSDSLNSVIVARNNDYNSYGNDDSDFDYNADYYRMKLNELNIDDAHDIDDNNDNGDDDDWNEHVDYSMNDKNDDDISSNHRNDNDDENFIIHGIQILKSLECEYQSMKIEEKKIRKVICDNNSIKNEQLYSLSELMNNDIINNDKFINDRIQISIDNMINLLNISTSEIQNLIKFIELMK